MGSTIGVIGVGGVGGYFGGKLCRSMAEEGNEVYFVARGQHLECIRQNGLLLRTEREGEWVSHPTLATDRIEELPVFDVCLLCVKSYDLLGVTERLRGSLSESTLVLPLLNGVDVSERIRSCLDTAQVLRGCAYIGTHIEAHGTVRQQGGACEILFGSDPKGKQNPPRQLLELFEKSRIKYAWREDVSSALWQKFIFIAAYGLVGASFARTLGEILDSSELSQQVQQVMQELARLAEKQGISLPESIVTSSFEKGREFAFHTKTSFHRDFEKLDKPDERDLFAGASIRLGKYLGVPTPTILGLYEVLERRKPWPT